ncbi:hypothetical protein CDL15_Pgr025993 [Punica granatum]|uniref:Uncharacterized protein n=1 Tax=Punica granatum TaxID=22663 RepID=A0A218WC92_PUNGR|nr:hypothetical protein CDL15_Pgr025993 [Punica granatum]PKI43288.1 hypothetical protein CRG98_036374 [Punica granatum]
MSSPTKRTSTGILGLLVIAQILCACAAEGEAQNQKPAAASSSSGPKIAVQSLETFQVGMPLYRTRKAPKVLIPGSKVQELYVNNNNV